MVLIFFHLKIETEIDADEEAGESDPEENGELDLSRVSEMRIILADPSQCILFLCA
jgi:chloride channel, nucleotide-sensitive, 1A